MWRLAGRGHLGKWVTEGRKQYNIEWKNQKNGRMRKRKERKKNWVFLKKLDWTFSGGGGTFQLLTPIWRCCICFRRVVAQLTGLVRRSGVWACQRGLVPDYSSQSVSNFHIPLRFLLMVWCGRMYSLYNTMTYLHCAVNIMSVPCGENPWGKSYQLHSFSYLAWSSAIESVQALSGLRPLVTLNPLKNVRDFSGDFTKIWGFLTLICV